MCTKVVCNKYFVANSLHRLLVLYINLELGEGVGVSASFLPVANDSVFHFCMRGGYGRNYMLKGFNINRFVSK